MTQTLPDDNPPDQKDTPDSFRERLMASIAEDASFLRPRLFSIYGVDHEGSPYLGWGMQLCDDDAFYYLPGARVTWTSKTAEQVHEKLNLAGEARLVWLDE
jgi:hypothetical protein